MKLGTFMMPVHPPTKDRTLAFEEDVEFVIRADQLGFTEAWIGQHNTLAWEPIPSNDVFIAHVLPQTRNIRLGPGVTLVPHHHPTNIALRLAYLDHLSRGRINCGFGQSGVPTDWTMYDLPDPRTQGLMTVEGIDLVLKLWEAEAPFDLQGEYWRIKVEHTNPEMGIGTMLRPYQKPHPPIAMSIIKRDSMAARMAGQRGYIPISTNLVPVETVANHWATYCAGAEEAGQSVPDRSLWRVSRSIYVGESNDEAWDHTRNGAFAGSFEYLLTLIRSADSLDITKKSPDIPDDQITPDYILENLCIIGDVKSCIQQLEELWDATGGFGTLLMIAHDWDDKEKWLNCMDRLVHKVLPALPDI